MGGGGGGDEVTAAALDDWRSGGLGFEVRCGGFWNFLYFVFFFPGV